MEAWHRNVRLYRWHRFASGLIFWQSVWFLYYQSTLSAADAILLYAIYDISTTIMEVPSGYMSDRIGRRPTLLAAAVMGFASAMLNGLGDSFTAFALANVLLGASAAFASGTGEAFLFQSLKAAGREDDVEHQELISWRFSFAALALSAVVGGAMMLLWPTLPYFATALAFVAMLLITIAFREPPNTPTTTPQGNEVLKLGSLWTALRKPALLWLAAISLLMYGFSHLPFVFGQPFILEALEDQGLASEAPLISGGVTAIMMGLSIFASLWAARLRRRIGLAAIVLVAFGMQIALAGILALTNSTIAIVFLFLRMVPDALSRPFIVARIQPELSDDTRATYMSLQSLLGRILFAGSLWLASSFAADADTMAYAEIQIILAAYVAVGVAAWLALAFSRKAVE